MYNPVLSAAILGWAAAQLIKFILFFVQNSNVRFERLYGSGGMPSSHSSFVCATLIATGRVLGWESPEFGIMFVISCVVMYDAAGVRRAAGLHAKELNLIHLRLFPSEDENENKKEEFTEFLGHTPFQVVCGAILGAVIGALIPIV